MVCISAGYRRRRAMVTRVVEVFTDYGTPGAGAALAVPEPEFEPALPVEP